jgi:hypothetical protein
VTVIYPLLNNVSAYEGHFNMQNHAKGNVFGTPVYSLSITGSLNCAHLVVSREEPNVSETGRISFLRLKVYSYFLFFSTLFPLFRSFSVAHSFWIVVHNPIRSMLYSVLFSSHVYANNILGAGKPVVRRKSCRFSMYPQ